jgi:hypothetical protein
VVITQQHFAIIGQPLQIDRKVVLDLCSFILLHRFDITKVFDMFDQRWLILDTVLPINHLGQLGKDSLVRMATCLLLLLLNQFPAFAFHRAYNRRKVIF